MDIDDILENFFKDIPKCTLTEEEIKERQIKDLEEEKKYLTYYMK